MNVARSTRRSLLALALVACAVPATPSAAAPITGQFVLDGKPLALREVAAFRVRDQFAPRTFETYVVLSATALDAAAIGAELDPYTAAINDPAVRDADFVAFTVGANGEVAMNAHVGGVQYIDTSGTMMGQRGSLVATCEANTTARVACSVKSPKPVKPMDGPTWSVDLAFASDVISRPVGKPLPAGGGDAGKAFLALRTAVGGNDLGKILAHLTPEESEDYRKDYYTPEENLGRAKEFLDMILPKKPKVTAGEALADDRALLEVEGEPYENGKMLYLVEMKRLDGSWRFASSSTVGMLK